MGIFNTIMLAATPLLPPEVTAYNYKSIQEINPYCYRIEYSIENAYPNTVEFLKIENANEFTAIMYCSENYSQAQEKDNYIELDESIIYNFDSSAGWWLSLAELQDNATNNYYSILCDNTIDFSVVVQRQRVDNYDIGYHNGYEEGEKSGYQEGEKSGFDNGYKAAVSEGKIGSYNWLTSTFNTLKNIFELELLPGLKLGYLIGIPFVITLVAFIISWFR